MSTIGPFYFNNVIDTVLPHEWSNPSNAEGAPDGSYAVNNINVNGSSNALLFTQWDGIGHLPPNVNLTSILIELYGFKDIIAVSSGVNFFANIWFNGNPAGSQIVGTLAFTTTPGWASLVRTIGANFIYNGNVDSTFGFRAVWEYDSGGFGSAPFSIDSARMTVQYNEGFYDPGYGFSKKTRRFKMTRNRRTRIVSQVKFKGAA